MVGHMYLMYLFKKIFVVKANLFWKNSDGSPKKKYDTKKKKKKKKKEEEIQGYF